MHLACMDPATEGRQHAARPTPIHSTVLTLRGGGHGRHDTQRLLGSPPLPPRATPS